MSNIRFIFLFLFLIKINLSFDHHRYFFDCVDVSRRLYTYIIPGNGMINITKTKPKLKKQPPYFTWFVGNSMGKGVGGK